jgi:tRNA nucleotidyltransferase/poly(A) polymerase
MNPTPPNPYAGRWVAKINGQVVSQGGTPEQARRAAHAARRKEKVTVEFVAPSSPLALPPTLERVRAKLPTDQPIYLVGGVLRDLLLGRQPADYDFVLASPAIPVARKLAKQLGADFYVLDEERDTARVLLDEDSRQVVLDFAALRGEDLESDLAARDFTINSIAMDLQQPGALLDPLGGALDLKAKRLKACAPTAFSDDPLRVLRGIRMAASFGLKIEDGTRAAMRTAAQSLESVSAERVRDELVRVLLAPKPATSLRALEMLGALAPVLPELGPLKGFEQNQAHRYDVWEHSLKTIEALGDVIAVLGETYREEGAGNLADSLVALRLGRYRQEISDYLRLERVPGRSLRALLIFAALYHDTGKPDTRQTNKTGDWSFTGHAARGAELIAARAEALHFSRAEIDFLRTVVAHHGLPTVLARAEEPPDRRAIYRFFQATGEHGIAVCLHSVADLMGKYGPELPRDELEARLDVLRALLEAYYEHHDKIVAPAPLLDGSELMEALQLAPGAKVGEILAVIREAQAAGEVNTREEALQLARQLST